MLPRTLSSSSSVMRRVASSSPAAAAAAEVAVVLVRAGRGVRIRGVASAVRAKRKRPRPRPGKKDREDAAAAAEAAAPQVSAGRARRRQEHRLQATRSPSVWVTTLMRAQDINPLGMRGAAQRLFGRGTFAAFVPPKAFGYVLPDTHGGAPDHGGVAVAPVVPEFAFVGRSNVGKSSLINALLGSTTTSAAALPRGSSAVSILGVSSSPASTTRRGSSSSSGTVSSAGIVRTSKTPGCTQTINYYGLFPRDKLAASGGAGGGGGGGVEQLPTPALYLVDLPGYGYAATASKRMVQAWSSLTRDFLLTREYVSLARTFVLVDARRGLSKVDREVLEEMEGTGVTSQLVVTKADLVSERELASTVQRLAETVHNIRGLYPLVFTTSARQGHGLQEFKTWITFLLALRSGHIPGERHTPLREDQHFILRQTTEPDEY